MFARTSIKDENNTKILPGVNCEGRASDPETVILCYSIKCFKNLFCKCRNRSNKTVNVKPKSKSSRKWNKNFIK